jgi:hypothetical protein
MQLDGAGYGGRLSLSRDQFSEALVFILKKGSANEVIYFAHGFC